MTNTFYKKILCLLFLFFSFSKIASADSYDDWYYKKTSDYQGWKYIVIHHSASSSGSVQSFDRFHTKQGYGGIAYHFVIGNGKGMKDGEVEETFRWKKQMTGTHVSVNAWDSNIFGIGICLVGNFENTKPTKKQIQSLTKLVKKLRKKHHIEKKNIWGHRHTKWDENKNRTEQTLCPGKYLDKLIKNLF